MTELKSPADYQPMLVYSFTLYSNFLVLQGSNLGPVVFNLYAADMKDYSRNCVCLQYADDFTDDYLSTLQRPRFKNMH